MPHPTHHTPQIILHTPCAARIPHAAYQSYTVIHPREHVAPLALLAPTTEDIIPNAHHILRTRIERRTSHTTFFELSTTLRGTAPLCSPNHMILHHATPDPPPHESSLRLAAVETSSGTCSGVRATGGRRPSAEICGLRFDYLANILCQADVPPDPRPSADAEPCWSERAGGRSRLGAASTNTLGDWHMRRCCESIQSRGFPRRRRVEVTDAAPVVARLAPIGLPSDGSPHWFGSARRATARPIFTTSTSCEKCCHCACDAEPPRVRTHLNGRRAEQDLLRDCAVSSHVLQAHRQQRRQDRRSQAAPASGSSEDSPSGS